MKIIVIGDSIAKGLGVQGKSYGDQLAAALRNRLNQDVALINMAGSAMQISGSRMLLPEIVSHNPDLIVLAHGITEAIVRPLPESLRYVPARWRKAGWLDPRPYFSRRITRRWLQKLESALRWRVKVLLLHLFGGATWKSRSEFEAQMADFVRTILSATTAKVILLTHCGIDERFFPWSSDSLEVYKEVILSLPSKLQAWERVGVCDITQTCSRWDDFFDDHFHPNASGHEKIAAELLRYLLDHYLEDLLRRNYEHFGNGYGMDRPYARRA